MPNKKPRETSKMLLWTVIVLSSVISMTALILAYLGGEFGVTVPVVGGIWSGAVPVAVACYSDKAKAENEIKLQQMRTPPQECDLPNAELILGAVAEALQNMRGKK
jgi:hypothetical protein